MGPDADAADADAADADAAGRAGEAAPAGETPDAATLLLHVQAIDRLALAGRLAGGLAHNLRHHLAGARAMLDWCRRQDPPGAADAARGDAAMAARTATALGHASRYLDQADALILAVLRLANSDRAPDAAASASAAADHADIAATLADLVRLVQHAHARAWRIAIHLPPDLPPVAAPRAVLLDVLLNLALNAFDALALATAPGVADTATGADLEFIAFTREGAPIIPILPISPILAPSPSTSPATSLAPARPAAPPPRDMVELRVVDHGPGLAPGIAATLFAAGSTTRADGCGLGLWMVRQQLTALGGTVHAEPTPGGGATFVLRLPAAASPVSSPAPSCAPASPSPVSSPAPAPATVLLVEDDALLRFCIVDHLEAAGWRVVAERDGDAALARCHDPTLALDLIVADYVVPGRHGTALVAALHVARPAVPILAISAWPEGRDRAALVAHGAAAFLAKPFALDALEATARRLVGDAAARARREPSP